MRLRSGKEKKDDTARPHQLAAGAATPPDKPISVGGGSKADSSQDVEVSTPPALGSRASLMVRSVPARVRVFRTSLEVDGTRISKLFPEAQVEKRLREYEAAGCIVERASKAAGAGAGIDTNVSLSSTAQSSGPAYTTAAAQSSRGPATSSSWERIATSTPIEHIHPSYDVQELRRQAKRAVMDRVTQGAVISKQKCALFHQRLHPLICQPQLKR